MKNLHIPALLTIILIASSFAFAEFGAPADLIQSARDRSEPAYIPDIMDQFSRDLLDFVLERKIRTPREKLALFITMNLFLSSAHHASVGAFSELRPADALKIHMEETARHCGLGEAFEIVKRAIHCDDENTNKLEALAFSDGFKALWETVGIFAQTLSKETIFEKKPQILNADLEPSQAGALAYRESEWNVLNFYLGLSHVVLSVTYRHVLLSLPKDSRVSPFVSASSWREFEVQHFCSASAKSWPFLKPWLSVFDSMMYGPSLLHFQVCKKCSESPVHTLQKELVLMISDFVAPRPWRKF